jgi:site-specific DNA recombinase
MLTPRLLQQFAEATRAMLRREDGVYRKDLLRAVAQRVEIRSPTELTISGCPIELVRTLAVWNGSEAAALSVPSRDPSWHPVMGTSENESATAGLVPTRLPKWRALLDSNQRPLA